jgi:hypothetical protein
MGRHHIQPLLASGCKVQEEFIVSSKTHPEQIGMLGIVLDDQDMIRLHHPLPAIQ